VYASLSRFIYRFRWFVIAAWLLITVAAMVGLPNLNTVVAHTKADFIPSDSPIVEATKLAKRINPKHPAQSTAIIAIHDTRGLTQAERRYFHDTLKQIDKQRQNYGLTYVEDAADSGKSAASAFSSHDRTTEIALVGFTHGVASDGLKESLVRLHEMFAHPPTGAHVYFTGDAPIQQDEIEVSMAGVEKTAYVTIALVLVILLLVFRTPVAPLVTLIAVGMSYLITTGLVAWLAKYGLPVSNFTQTFLIAVLFGAGTDYSIIILNRYREELAKNRAAPEAALTQAVSAIGKTVLFSGLTVLTSFAVLYLARFGLYRSGVGVAIGMGVLILVCFTFIPAFIGVLGHSLFWPRRFTADNAHRPSRIWGWTGGLAVRRPWWTLAALLAVLTPVGLLFTDQRTFDPMGDIPGAPSTDGFRIVSNAFGPGQVMPLEIVLKSDRNLRTPQGLASIERISRALAASDGVKQVDSATRPEGRTIEQFQLATQNDKAAYGLNRVGSGLDTLSQRLDKAASGVRQSATGSQRLVVGSSQVTEGAKHLANGLGQVTDKTGQLTSGARKLADGAGQIDDGATQLSSGLHQSTQGADRLAKGLNKLQTGITGPDGLVVGSARLDKGQQLLAGLSDRLAEALMEWTQTHPEDASDQNWQAILAMAELEKAGQTKAAQATQQLQTGAKTLASTVSQLNQGAQQLDQGLARLTEGADTLSQSAGQLASGAQQVANGSAQLGEGVSQLSTGAQRLADGSSRVTSGISTLASSLSQAPSGLYQASDGAARLGDGLDKVQQFLKDSKAAQRQGDPGFYLPASTVAHDPNLQKAMDAYISPDGHVAKFSVVLTANPYSNRAIAELPQIERAARLALAASPIHEGTIMAAGTTAEQAELNRISSQDFARTVALILTAIFILLVLMLRSILTPMYIIASLAATYFVTMGGLQVLFVNILGKPGLNWVVPFFVFLILVALGVDYSIFLMTRFEEEQHRGLPARAAIHAAMRNMGGVIFSAAIIMAGTFGSMVVTRVSSLVEIATAVMLGIALYTVVVLAFCVPACASVIGRGHDWPFRLHAEDSRKDPSPRARPISD
jgi:RND superfamily putative drug exporter